MLNFNEFKMATSSAKTANAAPSASVAIQKQEIEQKPKTENILCANPSQMIFSKSQFATTLAITSVISGALAFAIGKNKHFPTKQVKQLTQDLAQANTTIQDLTNKNNSQTSELAKLEKKIKELLQSRNNTVTPSKDTQEAINAHINAYRKIISETSSIYENAPAPKGSEIYYRWIERKFAFNKAPFVFQPKKDSTFIQNLLNRFKTEGRIEIPLKHKPASQANLDNASIKDRFLSKLGITQETNILKEYGNSANWSDEKIARDIIQNFYDGNGHNLDDVGILIQKTPTGKYKIKISGNGVFDHEKLIFLGGTTKKDPYDAGGFGEGAKVACACLISKGHTSKIRFASADWKLDFDEKGNIIRTTLNKSNELLNGNYVEFETENEDFAQQIIKALDYFKHSKNPDFNGLTFENNDFGFRILNKGEKGNFYLTQRFEFGEKGKWENGVEGLDIVFKRRPDAETYKKITGNNFDTGRDRTTMYCQDIFDLTRCFAKNMSDEEIINALLSTQKHWQIFESKENRAIKSFVQALISEAKERKIGIDFSKEKFCYLESTSNETVYNAVRSLGYTVIKAKDCDFGSIGMPGANSVFKAMSNHSALTPTQKEIKRMKVLEEAIKVIQENFEKTYLAKLKDIFSNITPEDIKISEGIDYNTKKLIESLEDFALKDNIGELSGYKFKINDIDNFNKTLWEYISKAVAKINNDNIDDPKNKNILQLMTKLMEENKENNERLSQYATQLKNLQIINKADVTAPRYIFDRNAEMAKNTLGEAIIDFGKNEYEGHWIDRTYLNNGNFFDLVATWMHEICHKSGGDGSAEFTYKLTDILEGLLTASSSSPDLQIKLQALEKIFNELN